MMVKGQDGEWINLRGADLDEPFVVGDPTFLMPRMTISIKSGAKSLERILAAPPSGRFPIDLTTPARRPKHRRHARGGLRRMVAARTRKFIAHGMTMKGDNTGAPLTFTMPVTKMC